jgi:hypothetical protein
VKTEQIVIKCEPIQDDVDILVFNQLDVLNEPDNCEIPSPGSLVKTENLSSEESIDIPEPAKEKRKGTRRKRCESLSCKYCGLCFNCDFFITKVLINFLIFF